MSYAGLAPEVKKCKALETQVADLQEELKHLYEHGMDPLEMLKNTKLSEHKRQLYDHVKTRNNGYELVAANVLEGRDRAKYRELQEQFNDKASELKAQITKEFKQELDRLEVETNTVKGLTDEMHQRKMSAQDRLQELNEEEARSMQTLEYQTSKLRELQETLKTRKQQAEDVASFRKLVIVMAATLFKANVLTRKKVYDLHQDITNMTVDTQNGISAPFIPTSKSRRADKDKDKDKDKVKDKDRGFGAVAPAMGSGGASSALNQLFNASKNNSSDISTSSSNAADKVATLLGDDHIRNDTPGPQTEVDAWLRDAQKLQHTYQRHKLSVSSDSDIACTHRTASHAVKVQDMVAQIKDAVQIVSLLVLQLLSACSVGQATIKSFQQRNNMLSAHNMELEAKIGDAVKHRRELEQQVQAKHIKLEALRKKEELWKEQHSQAKLLANRIEAATAAKTQYQVTSKFKQLAAEQAPKHTGSGAAASPTSPKGGSTGQGKQPSTSAKAGTSFNRAAYSAMPYNLEHAHVLYHHSPQHLSAYGPMERHVGFAPTGTDEGMLSGGVAEGRRRPFSAPRPPSVRPQSAKGGALRSNSSSGSNARPFSASARRHANGTVTPQPPQNGSDSSRQRPVLSAQYCRTQQDSSDSDHSEYSDEVDSHSASTSRLRQQPEGSDFDDVDNDARVNTTNSSIQRPLSATTPQQQQHPAAEQSQARPHSARAKPRYMLSTHELRKERMQLQSEGKPFNALDVGRGVGPGKTTWVKWTDHKQRNRLSAGTRQQTRSAKMRSAYTCREKQQLHEMH